MTRASSEENIMTKDEIEVVVETSEVEVEEVVVDATEVETEVAAEEVAAEVADVTPIVTQAEIDTAAEIATLKLALKAAQAMLETLAAENVSLAKFKDEAEVQMAAEIEAREVAEKAAAKDALREARLSTLPKLVRTDAESEEKASMLESWLAMTDEQWEATQSMFAKAAIGTRSKVEASQDEGALAFRGEENESGHAITKWLSK
jgi:hypothetical protein